MFMNFIDLNYQPAENLSDDQRICVEHFNNAIKILKDELQSQTNNNSSYKGQTDPGLAEKANKIEERMSMTQQRLEGDVKEVPPCKISLSQI